jgi:glycogen debranching enzyme
MKLLEKAYQKARGVLKECVDPMGTKASALVSGYPQIWARDAMITMLGASLIKDKTIRQSLKKSLETLAAYQSELGAIPNNVDVRAKAYDTRALMDGNSLYIIGHYVYYKSYKDLPFLKKYYPSIKKTILWLRYQDSNDCGLLEMQEATDWKDLFVTRGNGFYVNVLFFQALSCLEEIASVCGQSKDAKFYQALAKEVREQLNKRFWLGDSVEWIDLIPQENHGKKIIEKEWWQSAHIEALAKLHSLPFYLAYIGFHDYGEWFDAFGNLAAIIFGVADKNKANIILDYVSQTGMIIPYPIKAVYPTQRPGYKDWREYYKKRSLNIPHHYHNGGIWPFLGGFYVAALVKMGRFREAREQLIKLAEANRLGKYEEWEFNEWLHGKYGLPLGAEKQAWSAGMYIYAYESLRRKNLIYF